MRAPVLAAAAVLCIVGGAIARSETPAQARDGLTAPVTGTASLAGVVTNDVTGRPIRRAEVSIANSERGLHLMTLTDDAGAFSFSELPPGRYMATATRLGFVNAAYGQKKTYRAGVAISLGEGEAKTGMAIRMPPGAVIAGTVRTAAGEPLPDARVTILRRAPRFDTGERTLVRAVYATIGTGDQTDERGAYRIFGLPPDDYYVVVTTPGPPVRLPSELRATTAAEVDWASRLVHGPTSAPVAAPPPQGPAIDYAPVFYPGVPTSARASAVTLKAGEERDDVDLAVDLVPTAKLSGVIVMAGGGAPPATQVSVVASDSIPGIPFSGFGGSLRAGTDGRFTSTGLLPGDYTIVARPVPPPNGSPNPSLISMFGLATISINGADVETTVTLDAGATVSGHVAFIGGPPPTNLAGIRVGLTARPSAGVSLGVPGVQTDAAGGFAFQGVPPGSYQLSAAPVAGGWQVRGATVGAVDASDHFVEIARADVTDAIVTFTNQPTDVSGSLVDAAGHPAPDYTVIVFPADHAQWLPQSRRVQAVRPASDGRFRVPNLPPGDYRIAAVSDVEPGEWNDAAFLADLVGASRPFSLAEGQKLVEDLRIAGGS